MLIVYAIVKNVIYNIRGDIYLSCKTGIYFAIDSSQSVVLVFYCGVGFYLIRKINNYVPNSDLEHYLHDSNKASYKFDLKVCIATFLGLFIVSNVYSITLFVYVNNYSQYNSCTRLTEYWWLN